MQVLSLFFLSCAVAAAPTPVAGAGNVGGRFEDGAGWLGSDRNSQFGPVIRNPFANTDAVFERNRNSGKHFCLEWNEATQSC